MQAAWLRRPAQPLLELGAALGLDAAIWPGRESPRALTYRAEIARDTVAALDPAPLRALVDAYGDALSCRFLLGDLPVLEVGPGPVPSDLARFRADTEGSPTVTLDLRLDKERLAARWCAQAGDSCAVRLYLFAQALAGLLQRGLAELEEQLWPQDAPPKTILLVPEHDIWLDGEYLALIGGDGVPRWEAAIPARRPDVERTVRMHAACAELLRWQGLELRRLTPLHLAVSGQVRGNDPLAAMLWVHLANLVVLYTANRTVAEPSGRMVATYHGAKESVEVVLGRPQDDLGAEAREQVGRLVRLVEWVYDPQWSSARSADRLSLVQSQLVQTLRLADRRDRFALLLRQAASTVAEVQWLWQAFVEERVEEYLARVRDLEDYVDATVQAFTEQAAGVIKSVSDTALAAVGALLGSFIAALVSPHFNQRVFTLGMIVYAGYVLIFPLAYNMANQWLTYGGLRHGFEERRRRLERRLSPSTVAEIVGDRVDNAQGRFRRTFWLTVAVYLLVIALALIAGWSVPGAFVAGKI